MKILRLEGILRNCLYAKIPRRYEDTVKILRLEGILRNLGEDTAKIPRRYEDTAVKILSISIRGPVAAEKCPT